MNSQEMEWKEFHQGLIAGLNSGTSPAMTVY
jgi:hypothetical protein